MESGLHLDGGVFWNTQDRIISLMKERFSFQDSDRYHNYWRVYCQQGNSIHWLIIYIIVIIWEIYHPVVIFPENWNIADSYEHIFEFQGRILHFSKFASAAGILSYIYFLRCMCTSRKDEPDKGEFDFSASKITWLVASSCRRLKSVVQLPFFRPLFLDGVNIKSARWGLKKYGIW